MTHIRGWDGAAFDRWLTNEEAFRGREEPPPCGNRKSLGTDPEGIEWFSCDCGDIHTEESPDA